MPSMHTAQEPDTLSNLLLQAVAHHREGRLHEAERIYRGILQAHPGHPDANHNLGVIAVQTGHAEAALPHFKVAIDAQPDVEQYWASYIDALVQLNRRDEAQAAIALARSHGLKEEAMDRLALQARGGISQPEREQLLGAFNRGDFEAAAQLAQKATREHPEDPLGWKVWGASLMQMGRALDAVMPMQRNLQLMPQDAEAHFNYGIAMRHMERLQEAESSFRKAIELKPDYAESHNNLGNLLRETGRLVQAESSLRQAIEARPDYAEAHGNLGSLLKVMGKAEEAEVAFRKAVELRPDYVPAHIELGNLLAEQGRLAEAETSFRQAIAISPGYPEAHRNLGNVLKDQGRMAEAEASMRQAIALAPAYAEAHNDLGNVLRDVGRVDEALASYRRGLAEKPDFAECHYNISQLKTYASDDPDMDLLRHLYQTEPKEENRKYLCFALAKACEDLGNYDEAFGYYAEGKRLRKKELAYSIENDRALFDRIRSAFETLPEMAPVPMKEAKPVLIVGMMRSGTSLVEQILATHSAVHGAGEMDTLGLLAVKHFLMANPDELDVSQACKAIAVDYFEKMQSVAEGKSCVIDKMPLNFRWLGFVLLANPEIRVVHTRREPMAVCWSNFKQYFPAKGLGFTCDLSDLAEYYKLYEDLMAFWHEKF
ncbi:MAG: tetratricopeptide repeat protein, partial [Betaproteobacteria bacterium]|nr:tetratricopeptide repeat protein [Betaproteobacteria bacterium]